MRNDAATCKKMLQVHDLAATSFAKLEADNDARRAKVVESDAAIADFCRRYSEAHGFSVRLTREQVRRDIAHRKAGEAA